MTQDTKIIVHYHEIALKRGNRALFEKQLKKNILAAGEALGILGVERLRGRMLVSLAPTAKRQAILEILGKVFGIAYFAPAVVVEQDIEAIATAAIRAIETRDRPFQSFRVETRRAQKAFPMNSMEVNRVIGARIQQKFGARVDLSHAELTVNIEIFDNQALIYTDRYPGPGGLPVGTGGKAVSLLSSGIDSPVASYKMIKRGVRLIFVHFHSFPYTSRASIENVERLVQVMATYQFKARLYLVPFLEYQQAITSQVPPAYRVIMYRRAMLRLAEKIALKHHADALVTGENVAQVASQTLANIRAINEVARLPILRPLAGDDKMDIIDMARRIGTYDISIQPYEDCCSLFVPENPETRGNLKLVHRLDAEIDHAARIEQALKAAEVKEFGYVAEGSTLS